jgi:Abnormal spindle-like microcephaly-assoc'd, ASPM-SPD-2-Hydin
MKVLSENRVLVLSSLLALGVAWMAGCAGMAEPLPTLSVAPSTLSVSTKVGSSNTVPVSVINTGTSPVTVSQVVVSGKGFALSGATVPMTLASNKSASFNIVFAPTDTGSVSGTVNISTDAGHRPASLPLNGAGSTTTPIVSAVQVSPEVSTPAPGGTIKFAALIQGATSNTAVNWSTTIGTITQAGVFTAPMAGGIGRITAQSVADPTFSSSAMVAIAGGSPGNVSPLSGSSSGTVTGVVVTPSSAASVTGGTLPFTATVQGTATNTSVTWTAALGTITSAGQYTAPAKAGTDTVTATSVADTTKSASATVKVTAGSTSSSVTGVAVSPATSSVKTSAKLQFSATVQGSASNKAVNWTAAIGTITSAGAYTAPATADTDTITATSQADSSMAATAKVTVTAASSPSTPSSSSSSGSCPSSGCPAFPGAEGGGAETVGGRGGVVMEVTTTADSGTGSLRNCVQASGPRTCVFRVAGVFNITSGDNSAVNPYLTIACQTAPGEVIIGGPQSNGAALRISTHDVIVRYCTFSPDNVNVGSGPDTGTVGITIVNCAGDGTLQGGGCYNIITDHVTTRWSGNKSWITTSNFTPAINGNGNGDGPNHNITVQWHLDYEPHEGHPVGYGTATDESCVGTRTNPTCLSPYEVNIDFHHNMFVNVNHRIPENSNGSTRWINNIIYNWGYYANEWLGAEIIDDINNKFIQGNLNGGAQAHPIHFTTNSPEMSGAPSAYVSGNIFGAVGASTVNSDQYGSLVAQITGENGDETGPIPGSWQRSSPMAASNSFPIVPDAANELDSILTPTIGNSQHVDCSGNWVSHRDAADSRIVAQYQNGGNGGFWPNGVTFTGQASFPSPSGNWQDNPVTNFTACTESLHDGIPDAWKAAQGLSTTDTSLYKKVAPNGYTWLENYINGN